uniref:Uncharacterized protein n=1 Tax=Tanacetum cinerariifolium TaxID=118510 RepID=A0A6L2J681_TANCI|nr:hypothetical protein [Tanacetum cinerariifolium]
MYDSIKITRAKHIDQTTALLTENENLKVQINTKLKCETIDYVTPKVLAHGMYGIDVEPIPPHYTMADMRNPASDVPTEQVPVIAPPTKTDDQIFLSRKWVPVGKSNCVLGIWDTVCFNSSIRLYSCQLDEQCFNLHKDILRDALDITLTNDNNPYVAPPLSDTVIKYVNTLGYPSIRRNVSAMSVNALYKPWRAILSMINMCLIEFVQSIQTFLTDRKNLTTASRGKKKTTHMLILNVRFVGKDGREIFGGATESPKATKVTKPKAAKATKPTGDKAPKLTFTQPPKPKPTPTQPSKVVLENKQKLVKDTPDEPSPAKRSKGGLVGKIHKPKSPVKLVDEPSDEDVPVKEPGPAHPVVIREPDFGRIQPLSDVQEKGKEKRRTPMPTEASRHAESPSLDVELALTDSETESNNVVPKINTGDQNEGRAGPNPGNHDEGQAGPNHGVQDEGQAGLNPGDAVEYQPQSSHVVHAGPNLEHMDLEATDAST